MSHTTEIDTVVFSDVAALRAAVKELQQHGVKCRLVEKATPRAYFPNQTGMGEAAYVLQLDDSPYDVGFYWDDARKGYLARTDLFADRVACVLGAKPVGKESREQAALGKLYQTYAIHAATMQAVKQGHTVRRVNKADGSVQLVVSVK